MLNFLPAPLLGVISLSFMVANTIFWSSIFFVVALVKLIIPVKPVRDVCTVVLIFFGVCWITCNNLYWRLFLKIDWDIKGLESLSPDEWYLVLSNHQTWVDIFVLQNVLNIRIPYLKFFLKKELIWVPIMGLVWWALDFPFMKRYSKDFLAKNPHLEGKDLEATRKACERFGASPVSVMNFLEGTRFTPEKHAAQNSPFRRLLKPKAGGIAFVLSAMDQYLTRIVDVTIVYPEGVEGFWAFLGEKINRIKVDIRVMPIGKELIGDYFNDPEYRESFQKWVNTFWEEKDARIEGMLGEEMSL